MSWCFGLTGRGVAICRRMSSSTMSFGLIAAKTAWALWLCPQKKWMGIFVLHWHTQDLYEFTQTCTECTVPNCAFAGGGDLTTRYFWRSNDNTQFGSFVAKRPWVKRELAWEMLVVGVQGCRKVSEMKTCFLFQHNFVSKGVHILQCTHPIGATSTRCPLMLDHPKVQVFSEICSEFLWCVTVSPFLPHVKRCHWLGGLLRVV